MPSDGALVRYNRRAVELWGRALRLGDREFSDGHFRRYTPEGVPLPFDATPVAVVLRSGVPVSGVELVIERPDGSQIPVLMNVAPLKDADGRVDGAVCSFQELTELKRAEEALRASEAELQSVINRTPFMLVRCSRDLRYRFVSEAYALLIGRGRDELIGKTIDEVIGADGLKTLQPYIDRSCKASRSISTVNSNFPHSGRRCLAIAYRPERDPDGKVGGWIASLLDITEQRSGEAARRQLANIVESSDDAIISMDLDGVVVSWNPGAWRLLGYSAEEMIGKSITTSFRMICKTKNRKSCSASGAASASSTTRLFGAARTAAASTFRSPSRRCGTSTARSSAPRKSPAMSPSANAPKRSWRGAPTSRRRCIASPTGSIAPTSLNDIYEAALDAIIAALHCSRASILRCDTDGVMRFVAWRGLSDRYRARHRRAIRRGAPEDANPEPVCMPMSSAPNSSRRSRPS